MCKVIKQGTGRVECEIKDIIAAIEMKLQDEIEKIEKAIRIESESPDDGDKDRRIAYLKGIGLGYSRAKTEVHNGMYV